MAITAGITAAAMQYKAAEGKADAQEAQAKFNAQQMEHNAELTQIRRREVLKQGEEDAFRRQEQVRSMLGKQKVNLAAQGIDVGDGTAFELMEETREIGREDVRMIKNNAWREAWGMQVEADNLTTTAQYTRMAGENAARNTMIQGGANALSTGIGAFS
jgi:hypothetical protein